MGEIEQEKHVREKFLHALMVLRKRKKERKKEKKKKRKKKRKEKKEWKERVKGYRVKVSGSTRPIKPFSRATAT